MSARLPDTALGRAFGDAVAQLEEHGGAVVVAGPGEAAEAVTPTDETDAVLHRAVERHGVDPEEAHEWAASLTGSALAAARCEQDVANAMGGALMLALITGIRLERDRG